MSNPISSGIDAAGDIGVATIQQATAEQVANEQAKAQEQLQQQEFNDQTSYISNQDQSLRDAILGVAASGNPYGIASGMVKPQYAGAGSGQFGGGSYSGAANGAPSGLAAGFTGAATAPTPAASVPIATKQQTQAVAPQTKAS